MKKIVLAALIVVAGAVSASAADLPVKTYTKAPLPPPCIWCGFYVGVNGGWGGSAQDNNFSVQGTDPLEDVSVTRAVTYRTTSGGFGGGQIGYNWVFPGGLNGSGYGWLLGVEADIQGASIRGSNALAFFADSENLHTAVASAQLNWFGTLRGRLGLTAGPVLLYGTGGFAFGGVKNNLNVTEADGSDCTAGVNAVTCASSSLVSNSSTRAGYVVGAGFEWMFAPSWSVKGEYQYINLGSVNQATSASVQDNTEPPEGTFGTHHVNERFNTVRLGVNYHFGGPVVAGH